MMESSTAYKQLSGEFGGGAHSPVVDSQFLPYISKAAHQSPAVSSTCGLVGSAGPNPVLGTYLGGMIGVMG